MGVDEARQAQARRYGALCRRILVAELSLAGFFLLALLLFGRASYKLKVGLEALLGAPEAVVVAYLATLIMAYAALSFPLTLYGGFWLPKHFGLLTQRLGPWLWDWGKGLGVGLVLGLVLVEVVYYLLTHFSSTWWLWAALFVFFLAALLAYLAPVVLVPLFFRMAPLNDAELARRLAALTERAGVRAQGVYTLNLSRKTTAANAALMGLGPTRRIVLGDTLLKDYTAEEIEVVLAHELGHHAHGDIPKGLAWQSALALAIFYGADQAVCWGVVSLGLEGPADVAAMPLWALVLGALGLVAMPLANGLARAWEGAADDA